MRKVKQMDLMPSEFPEKEHKFPPEVGQIPQSKVVDYEPIEYAPDFDEFHSITTISLGELIRDGVCVWGEPLWLWDYYDIKQYYRVSEKIEQHYWNRDIGFATPNDFRREFIRHMNENMPKWKMAYKAVDDKINLMHDSNTYGKNRSVASDFPATQLNAELSDYASNANDYQFESVHDGDYFDRIVKLKQYNDIDTEIVNSCEKLFSCLFTVNLNGGFGL